MPRKQKNYLLNMVGQPGAGPGRKDVLLMAEENKGKQVNVEEKKRQFNKFQLSGNLGADPKYSKEKEYLTFPLPVENSLDEATGWLQAVLFGDKAHEAAGKNLKKGSYVQITNGRLKVVPWEANGKKGTNVEVVVFDINYFEDQD